jgi:hypothetical protein
MNGSTDPNGEAGLLAHFTSERLLESLADLDAPSGEVPATGVQVYVVTAPEQKETVATEDEPLDPDPGPLVSRHPAP